jgi:hypothetical protein
MKFSFNTLLVIAFLIAPSMVQAERVFVQGAPEGGTLCGQSRVVIPGPGVTYINCRQLGMSCPNENSPYTDCEWMGAYSSLVAVGCQSTAILSAYGYFWPDSILSLSQGVNAYNEYTEDEDDLLPFFLPLITEKQPSFYPLTPA